MVHIGYGHGLISEELMGEFERNCPHLDFLYRNKPDVPEEISTNNTVFPQEASNLITINEEKEKETTIWPSSCNDEPFMSDFENNDTTKEN